MGALTLSNECAEIHDASAELPAILCPARAIPPIEALLASTMDTWPEDTEDELLAANIRKGEQAKHPSRSVKQNLCKMLSCSSSWRCSVFVVGRCASDCAGISPSDAFVHTICSCWALEQPWFQRDLSLCRACPHSQAIIQSRMCKEIIDQCLGETWVGRARKRLIAFHLGSLPIVPGDATTCNGKPSKHDLIYDVKAWPKVSIGRWVKYQRFEDHASVSAGHGCTTWMQPVPAEGSSSALAAMQVKGLVVIGCASIHLALFFCCVWPDMDLFAGCGGPKSWYESCPWLVAFKTALTCVNHFFVNCATCQQNQVHSCEDECWARHGEDKLFEMRRA